MFIKYYVFLSFGDDFERDTKAIHLKVKFKPTLFVPHINDVGKRERERERVYHLFRFWKNIYSLFSSAFLLHFMSADMRNGTKHNCFKSDHCKSL